MTNTQITYLVGAGCGLIALIAFCTLVLVPAFSSYRGALGKVGAFVLSLYVVAAFVGIGIALGLWIILQWPHWF